MSETHTRPRNLADRVRDEITALQNSLLTEAAHRGSEAAKTRADLAELRRAVTLSPGESMGAWEHTIGILARDERKDRMEMSDAPSRQETAVHYAVTLWALHQQSKTERMHAVKDRFGRPCGLGWSVRALVESDGASEDAVQRRFHTLLTSESVTELAHHLRAMIGQLRSARAKNGASGIPLDYGQLAQDIYAWIDPESRATVRLRWGREYLWAQYRVTQDAANTTTPETTITAEEN